MSTGAGIPLESPGAPPPPATRTLAVVLREALERGEEVRMIVAKALADSGQNANAYLNVEIEGQAVTIPKVTGAGLGGSGSGYPVYVLATKDFMLAVGTVAASAAAASGGGLIPIGGILQWPTAAPPAGWLMLDGSSFSAVTYPLLAAVLGTTVLPNYCRRVPVGRGSGGSGGYEVGATDGLAEGSRGPYHHHHLTQTINTDSQGNHQHGSAGAHWHNPPGGQYFAVTGLGLTVGAGTVRYAVADGWATTDTQGDHTHPAAGAHQHTATVNADTSGGNGSDAPAFIVTNFIIRAQ